MKLFDILGVVYLIIILFVIPDLVNWWLDRK